MTTPSDQTCPTCGASASGRYCASCGTALVATSCHRCGAPLDPAVRYCPRCGTGRAGAPGSPLPVSWAIGGAGALLVVAGLAFLLGRWSGRASSADAFTGASTPVAMPPGGFAPDISNLTPREAAQRLFDRVMRLADAGAGDSVAFFAPMALQAYAQLGPPDNDARYDMGMILAVSGDLDGAIAQADSLDAAVPGHLLATALREQVAEVRGDSAAMRRALRQFLQQYPKEIVEDRPEYDLHRQTIETLHDEAQRTLEGIG